jgi:hypothetical protein
MHVLTATEAAPKLNRGYKAYTGFDLIAYMQGRSFVIPDSIYNGVIFNGKVIYKGIKDYLDLSPFIVERSKSILMNPKNRTLGEKIELRFVDHSGAIAVVTPEQMEDLIAKLNDLDSDLGKRFENELTYQAFYGVEKRKSY